MNKRLLWMLATVAMLTGCSQENVVDSDINQYGNAISFATYKNVTRGNPVDQNSEFMTAGNTFGVTAFISGETSPYMGEQTEGVKIVSDGTKWNYDNPAEQAFWPVGEQTLDFFAYYPAETAQMTDLFISKVAPFLSFSYTVAAQEKDQVDLMFASKTDVTKPADKNSVILPFKHALTQVHFKIGTKTERLKVDVEENGITICNMKNQGTFTLPGTQTDNGWSNLSGKADYIVTSSALTEIGYVGVTSNLQYTTVGESDKALMLLPQTFVAATAPFEDSEGAYLVIRCKIYQMLADGTTKVYLKGSEDAYEAVNVPISSQKDNTEIWNRGKKVTYNLLIGASGTLLQPIEFESEVDAWEDAEGGVIENK